MLSIPRNRLLHAGHLPRCGWRLFICMGSRWPGRGFSKVLIVGGGLYRRFDFFHAGSPAVNAVSTIIDSCGGS